MKRLAFIFILIFCVLSIHSQEVTKEQFNAWLQSAMRGDSKAQYNVGWCYDTGNGTETNEYKAFEWYMKAAQQGLPNAQYNVGLYYHIGHGTEKDPTKAFEWTKKAADEECVPAYNDLAYCYMRGWGVAKDSQTAWMYLNKALEADPENPSYIDTKGEFYAIEGNKQKAMETWNEINKKFPNYFSDEETPFSKYIKQLNNNGVDTDIPSSTTVNKNIFAIVIANENYQDVSAVPFAINDGQVFTEYCQQTLGIPQSNISFIKDATLNNMRREINWLKQILTAYNGEASVIFYYAGHGIPDETGSASYLLPCDGIGNDVSTGYSLKDLYTTLGSQPAKHILVFLDACFSGANRDGKMLASARGVAIKAKNTTPTGNLVVFSATQGDETALPYKDQQHGLFTYYLLKKIKDTKGNVSLGELGDYVCSEVKKQSIVTNRKSQTPVVNASISLDNNWKSWKIK